MPFYSFLKRARIGDKTTFNLEFYLTNLPENLELLVPSRALASTFSIETSGQHQNYYSSSAYSKTHYRNILYDHGYCPRPGPPCKVRQVHGHCLNSLRCCQRPRTHLGRSYQHTILLEMGVPFKVSIYTFLENDF